VAVFGGAARERRRAKGRQGGNSRASADSSSKRVTFRGFRACCNEGEALPAARGFPFVEMANANAARAMQALNGADFEGRTLRINAAESKDRPQGGGDNRQSRY